jgi:hypothetical protein
MKRKSVLSEKILYTPDIIFEFCITVLVSEM